MQNHKPSTKHATDEYVVMSALGEDVNKKGEGRVKLFGMKLARKHVYKRGDEPG